VKTGQFLDKGNYPRAPKPSVKRILGIFAFLCLATPARAQDVSSAWKGTFKPISKACEGSDLQIADSTLSYSDCREIKIQSLVNNNHEFSFIVDPAAKCSWSGWVISLKRNANLSRSHLDVNGYESVKDFHGGNYTFDCDYLQQ
jgi:hypothetical protein